MTKVFRSWLLIICMIGMCLPTFAEEAGKKVTITGSLSGYRYKDNIYLLRTLYGRFDTIASAKLIYKGGKARFTLQGKIPQEGVYFIGHPPYDLREIMLYPGDYVRTKGTVLNMKDLEVMPYDSQNKYIRTAECVKQLELSRMFIQPLTSNKGDESEEQRHMENVKQFNAQLLHLLDSIPKREKLIKDLLAVQLHPMYHPSLSSYYANEEEHYAKEFFKYVDFESINYEYLPHIYEQVMRYTRGLLVRGFSGSEARTHLDALLNKVPHGSIRHNMILIGVLTALLQEKQDLFIDYGNLYLKIYKEQNPAYAEQINQYIAEFLFMPIGSLAPNFRLPTPDGNMLSLEQLKGNYVLIDFWASWCRPCRIENKELLPVYEKFKNDNFTILGVSLDKNRDAWLDAIGLDGMEWHHASDLKYWESPIVSQYKLNAIPFNILIDPEGKIIAKGIQPHKLEQLLTKRFR